MRIPEEVMAAVQKEETVKQSKVWYETLKSMVSCKHAVAKAIDGLDEEMAELVNDNNTEIKILPVKANSGKSTGYFAIFNLAEIEGRENPDCIVMEVPTGKEGLILGAGKWQVSEWVRSSWLRRLYVKKIWVKGV